MSAHTKPHRRKTYLINACCLKPIFRLLANAEKTVLFKTSLRVFVVLETFEPKMYLLLLNKKNLSVWRQCFSKRKEADVLLLFVLLLDLKFSNLFKAKNGCTCRNILKLSSAYFVYNHKSATFRQCIDIATFLVLNLQQTRTRKSCRVLD